MNRLAKYIIIIAVCAIILFLAWYFSSILTSLLIAAVISLIGQPLMNFLTSLKLGKLRIKINKSVAALITLTIIAGAIFLFFFFLFPMIGRLISDMSSIDFASLSAKLEAPLAKWNMYMHKFAPTLDPGVTIESMLMEQLQSVFNIDLFTNVFSSFTSFLVHFLVSTFTVIFVAFFFLQDSNSFTKMILMAIPEKYVEHTNRALKSVYVLLVRYFTGISLEAILITILNTIGLHFICGVDFSLALILAFISGVLNVIPYIGPWVAGAFGTLMGIVSLYGAISDPVFGTMIIKFILTFFITHMIDVFIFQPYIYSNSVKAHPLEIFLIILIGGNIAGVVGMLIAIPVYTAIRVFAVEFFSEMEFVKRFFINRGSNK
jgi:predicted PurR-regulated permease PerM